MTLGPHAAAPASPLAQRLRRAFGSSLRTTTDEPRSADYENGITDGSTWSPHIEPAESILPGVEIETAEGTYQLHQERFPLGHRHGGFALGDCLSLPPRALALLLRTADPADIDLRQAVFLDVETTGLAGGTGTSAFLVGIAHFETVTPPDAFVVRQFFMRDFSEERAMLLGLADALAPFRHVVSFNGKSYDLPLLETRFILARLPNRWRPRQHFDLLHPARRLWRERFESCSLGYLEEAVLGHRRDSDVPSWAIPGLYSDYLRFGLAAPLQRVFSHNRHDLLSLAALCSHLGRRLGEPLSNNLAPDELLAVARLHEQVGLRDEARSCLELALKWVEPPLRQRVQLQLALACKRAGLRDRAFQLWRELSVGHTALAGLIELAKHHEHHRRDPATALDIVEQALGVLELREAREGRPRWRMERADLERRQARLLRKRGVGSFPSGVGAV